MGLCICKDYAYACFHGISLGMQLFQENRRFTFQARIVLKPMVSLIDRLVACITRISVDRQTDKPSTETLAAHVHAGVVGLFRSTCVRDTPMSHCHICF